MTSLISVLTASYLIGALPVGRVVGLFYSREDIWDYGDGTASFSNLVNVLGVDAALLKVLLDIGKGLFLGYLIESQGYGVGVQNLALILLIIGFRSPLGQKGQEGSLVTPLYSFIWYLYPDIGGLCLASFIAVIVLKGCIKNAVLISSGCLLLSSVWVGADTYSGLTFVIAAVCALTWLKERSVSTGTFTNYI